MFNSCVNDLFAQVQKNNAENLNLVNKFVDEINSKNVNTCDATCFSDYKEKYEEKICAKLFYDNKMKKFIEIQNFEGECEFLGYDFNMKLFHKENDCQSLSNENIKRKYFVDSKEIFSVIKCKTHKSNIEQYIHGKEHQGDIRLSCDSWDEILPCKINLNIEDHCFLEIINFNIRIVITNFGNYYIPQFNLLIINSYEKICNQTLHFLKKEMKILLPHNNLSFNNLNVDDKKLFDDILNFSNINFSSLDQKFKFEQEGIDYIHKLLHFETFNKYVIEYNKFLEQFSKKDERTDCELMKNINDMQYQIEELDEKNEKLNLEVSKLKYLLKNLCDVNL
jgi:hypothetical protein